VAWATQEQLPRGKGLCPTPVPLPRPCRREVGSSLGASPTRPGPPPMGSSTLRSHVPATHGTSLPSIRAHQPVRASTPPHLTLGGYFLLVNTELTPLTGRGGSFPVFPANAENTRIPSLEDLSVQQEHPGSGPFLAAGVNTNNPLHQAVTADQLPQSFLGLAQQLRLCCQAGSPRSLWLTTSCSLQRIRS